MVAYRPASSLEVLHAATDRAMVVVVPPRRLLAIDGVGPPAGSDFQFATRALRTAGEELRRRLRVSRLVDTSKEPIECAWWTHPERALAEMVDDFPDGPGWHWQQMLEIPWGADEVDVEQANRKARHRDGRSVPLIRLVETPEGAVAQILRAGATSEQEAARRLIQEVLKAGLVARGHLHEVYLGDPGQVPVERARTILRLPVVAD